MNIYLQEEVVFSDKCAMLDFLLKLPAFVVYKVNSIHICKDVIHYQVMVYCFDDEIDVSDYC